MIVFRNFLHILKWVLLFCVIAGLLYAPGDMHIAWLGYDIQTSVAVFILVLAFIIALLAIVVRSFLWVLSFPHRWLHLWKHHRQEKAEDALIEAVVAISSGEFDEAHRLSVVASKNLTQAPFVDLIQAQAAFMKGDTHQARHIFRRMQENPQTRFLGLRGEALYALQHQDWHGAHTLLNEALKERPRSPWVMRQLLEVVLRVKAYDQATRLLEKTGRLKTVSKKDRLRYQAYVYWIQAKQARQTGNDNIFYQRAKKAHESLPENIEIARQLADHDITHGRQGKARKILLHAWSLNPHPQLVGSLLRTSNKITPLDGYRFLMDSLTPYIKHSETQLTLGEAAAKARLWGQARQHVHALHGHEKTQRYYRLMTSIAQGETPEDFEAIQSWLQAMGSAQRDPVWTCQACSAIQNEWELSCDHCGALDSLIWTTSHGKERGLIAHL